MNATIGLVTSFLNMLALAGAAAAAEQAQITVHADRPMHPVSRLLTGACIEDVNHEIYGGLYSQMIFGESFQEPPAAGGDDISGMWRGVRRGNAAGAYRLEKQGAFVGVQSQRIELKEGDGAIGIENRGL